MKRFFSNKANLLLLAFIMLGMTDFAMAQPGSGGLTTATTDLKKYIPLITNLIMAIGGVVGIAGSIRIYSKWNNGDNDINKELMGYGGSCLFLIVAPLVIKGFFGV